MSESGWGDEGAGNESSDCPPMWSSFIMLSILAGDEETWSKPQGDSFKPVVEMRSRLADFGWIALDSFERHLEG